MADTCEYGNETEVPCNTKNLLSCETINFQITVLHIF
jgi:hypothetical protein